MPGALAYQALLKQEMQMHIYKQQITSITSSSRPLPEICRVNFLVLEHNLRTWNKLAPKACPFEITDRFRNVTPGSIFMFFSKHGLLLMSCVHWKSP